MSGDMGLRIQSVAMTQTSAGFRRMAWLALVAVLLAVAAPTISRTLVATGAKVAPILMEMCTTAGNQLVDVSPFIAGEEPARPMTAMDEACGYCVLATPLPLVLLLLCLLGLRPPRVSTFGLYTALLRSPRNTRGLGAQAPPLAL